MKNLIVSFLLALSFLLGAQASLAQQQGNEVKAVKISYITDMMKLSSAQASQFWPIYNKYDTEMRNVRRGIRSLTTEKGKTAEEIIDERQKLSEKEVSIKARYNEEFLKVVSASQLNQMYAAEAKFKQYLIDRMKKK